MLQEKRREKVVAWKILKCTQLTIYICFVCLREISNMKQGKEISLNRL